MKTVKIDEGTLGALGEGLGDMDMLHWAWDEFESVCSEAAGAASEREKTPYDTPYGKREMVELTEEEAMALYKAGRAFQEWLRDETCVECPSFRRALRELWDAANEQGVDMFEVDMAYEKAEEEMAEQA